MRRRSGIAAALASAALALGVLAAPAQALARTFTDVPETHWAYATVDEATDAGIMNGYPDGAFGPDATVTRGQIATIMWNAAGSPEADAPDFPDVDYSMYYGDAIEWVRSESVFNGYPDGRFGPEDPVTREMLAAILRNFEVARGGDGLGDADRLGRYPDGAQRSDWATEGLAWAVESGVMGNGAELGAADPTTRAEACAMVLNYTKGADERPALLKAHFIDVGQGDSCFVELPNGQTMLVDAGTARYGQSVVDYVRSRGHSRVDYLVMTHPDADHVGGMATVIRSLEIGEIFAPACGSTTQTWEGVLDAVADKGMTITTASAGVSVVRDGELSVSFVAPASIVEGETNENSAVTWIDYGGRTYDLTGDADAYDLAVAAPGHADVLKVSHHGSNTGTTQYRLDRITPYAAVISCGAGNPYGHPTASVLSMLYASGASVYRTDQQGTVSSYCDTEAVWFSTTPTAQPAPEPEPTPEPDPAPVPDPDPAPEPEPEPEPTPDPGPDMGMTVYITKTGEKYHLSWCTSLRRSKIAITLGNAIARGYEPCKICNPPA